ncbi:MAG: family 20 glycosylhydrolase [Candidatus Poribacteria bacterium]|nr:family 20 glycosylhydrolase [Candidatus Poribacteria bacterium]
MPDTTTTQWRGVHVLTSGPDDVPVLKRAILEELVPLKVNVLIFEVDFGFAFESHPELRGWRPFHAEQARDLARFCRQHGVRLIPQFNCLGHQSWARNTHPLLTAYREFDETPDIPLDNPDIYCRSWCPLHPTVNDVVFPMLDEIAEAFEADAFHVGLDEVFLIASDQCERCRGKDPAELFAKAVNDYHAHLVGQRGLTMLMWGDRLLDAETTGYGKWEASANGTAPAIDLIPTDIVQCDWHYERRKDYPSVRYFQEKGFPVLPSSWKSADASEALIDCAAKDATDKMLGHLCTTWTSAGEFSRTLLGDNGTFHPSENARDAAHALRVSMNRLG